MNQESMLEASAKRPFADVLLGSSRANHPIAMPWMAGLALSATYGLAIGTRTGGVGVLRCGAAVPVAVLVVTALATPSLVILLTALRVATPTRGVFRAVSHATAVMGLLLAGLAPAMALFVVTSRDAGTVSALTTSGLLLAGAFALGTFVTDVDDLLSGCDSASRLFARLACAVFLVFVFLLSLRVFGSLFGGIGGVA